MRHGWSAAVCMGWVLAWGASACGVEEHVVDVGATRGSSDDGEEDDHDETETSGMGGGDGTGGTNGEPEGTSTGACSTDGCSTSGTEGSEDTETDESGDDGETEGAGSPDEGDHQ